MNPESRVVKILAKLYEAGTKIRGVLYQCKILPSYASKLPVISIGNLTAGGNGKTPLCLFLVRELRSRGYKPVILSRGYGGSLKGPHRVSGEDSASRVGDEPLLMARSTGLPVYISRKRAAGARLIERDAAGDVIVLDDGFQHRALSRDLDILSVFAGTDEAVDEFVKGKLIPVGTFRENRDSGLRRSGIVVAAERRVLNSRESLSPLDPRLLELIPDGVKVFRSYLEASGVEPLSGSGNLSKQPVVAFAGVAQPEGFFYSLEELGYTILERRAYPDHHAFARRDLDDLRAKHPSVPLVCTEKDAVKIRELGYVSGCWVLKVDLRVIPGDAFMVHVIRSIGNARARKSTSTD